MYARYKESSFDVAKEIGQMQMRGKIPKELYIILYDGRKVFDISHDPEGLECFNLRRAYEYYGTLAVNYFIGHALKLHKDIS